ncbi:TIGR03620 family F420-dependent LLM class oxidoreductase [Nocardia panacis]|nr:TIGR03620 family F420-dependent LLM class oxidoreductase [Nocardia panacis]
MFGKFGVWLMYPAITGPLVRELEELGYGTIWVGGSPAGDWQGYEELLAASESIVVAPSIVNVWASPAKAAAETYHRLAERFPGRYRLGIGAGHREHTDVYRKPYDALVEYLDELDAAGVPKEGRLLAALGPRVAALAAERTGGLLPYFVPTAHTAATRAAIGSDPLLAPEHKFVLGADPQAARAIARDTVTLYLGLTNYVQNLRRFPYTEQDLTAPGTDRITDDVVAHGTPEQVADKLIEHLRAGADHVAVQPLGSDPISALRTLAPVLAERAAALG